MKERYAVTAVRILVIRMQFGPPERSSLSNGLVLVRGMLGAAGNGKLRVLAGPSKLAAKVAKRFKEKHYGSSGATGLTSSLAFTPVQISLTIYCLFRILVFFSANNKFWEAKWSFGVESSGLLHYPLLWLIHKTANCC